MTEKEKVTGSTLMRGTGQGKQERVWYGWKSVWLVKMGLVLLPTVSWAAMKEEASVGLFYRITHMHPLVYVVLFVIFLASVINLFFHVWIPSKNLSLFVISRLSFLDRLLKYYQGIFLGQRSKRGASPSRFRPRAQGKTKQGAYVRKVDQSSQFNEKTTVFTPLSGVNHTLPRFVYGPGSQTGVPRLVDAKPEKRTAAHDFRFSAAVEVPPQDELQRREKEQLVVSGIVKGPDGKGLGSVIVYLSDQEGNRVGQPSRTHQETGEFKVLINHPGQYFLNTYKRGFLTDPPEPVKLPLEAGKIEGFLIKMIPEGCAVHGRVLTEREGEGVSDVIVKCFSRTTDFERTSRTDAQGSYRIIGVPVNSECYIEVLDAEGRSLTKSHPFQTVQKREITQNIVVSFPFSHIPSDTSGGKSSGNPPAKASNSSHGETEQTRGANAVTY